MGLYHSRKGSGPCLVLLHGLFGSCENLNMLSNTLSEHFDVISVDLPNHGRSAHSELITLGSMADDLLSLFDAEHIERPLIVGHSLGGKVAMEFALKYPERVEKLVVLDIAPVAYPARHELIFEGLFAVDLEIVNSRLDADRQLEKYIGDINVRGFLLKNLVRADENTFKWRVNLVGLRHSYKDLVGANTLPKSGAVEMPTLFIYGEHSDYVDESMMPQITQRFAHTSMYSVPAGHWLHIEATQKVLATILDFL